MAFCSSPQDSYVPFESARVQICKEAIKDQKLGSAYIEMASNILGRVRGRVLFRIDINVEITGKRVDNMIGRTAHI